MAGPGSVTSPLESASEPRPHPTDTLRNGSQESTYVPRPKRVACVVCRRRKLKCDSQRPSCGNCSRLGHHCAYDESRKKSGPKRGYVKQLEARLAQVENLLQEPSPTRTQQPAKAQENVPTASTLNQNATLDTSKLPELPAFSLPNELGGTMPPLPETDGPSQLDHMFMTGANPGTLNDCQGELIGLGFEESLPSQDVINELDQLFFEKINPLTSLIHRPRFLTAMKLAPNMRPPACLRYSMWCHAAMTTDKYFFLHEIFYQRARKYAEIDEMKGIGQNVLSVAYSQAILLISMYEFKTMNFPRAWLTVGKVARLVVMLGFNSVDAWNFDVKQCMPPPRDWIEQEERRRTFWCAFCADRFASMGTGWPMVFDERDIMTNLPATDDSFLKGKPEPTPRLADIFTAEGASALSPLGGVVLVASLLGHNHSHIHRPDAHDNEHDLNGEFWKRHRAYDNIMLNIALTLPSHLRLPNNIGDLNVVFCNMGIHTSTIGLHQAAILKAEINKVPSKIVTESKRRCLVAADQVSSILKLICHMDLSGMNPFMAFCIYSAARVFTQYLKSNPHDLTVQSSLEFVLNALNALKNKIPVCESFLAQLDVDIEGLGIQFENLTKPAAASNVCSKFEYKNNSPAADDYRDPADAASTPQQSVTQLDSPNIYDAHPNLPATDAFSMQRAQATQQQSQNATASNGHMPGSANLHNDTTTETVPEIDKVPDTCNNSSSSCSDNPTPIMQMNPSTNSTNLPSVPRTADQPMPQLSNPVNTSNDNNNNNNNRNNTNSMAQVPCVSGSGPFSQILSNYPTGSPSPNYDGQHGGGFSKYPTWDSLNPPTPSLDDIHTAQWAQILSATGWGGNW